MSRTARSNLSTYTYFHICSRGNNSQDIFLNEKDYFHFLQLLKRYLSRFRLKCFAYCLMTNHIHLLLLASSIKTLSKAIHGINLSYVIYFNRQHQRSGHLFQDRFSSWVVLDQNHFLQTKEYIENNPVKAGMVRHKEDYPWSSAYGDGSGVTLEALMS